MNLRTDSGDFSKKRMIKRIGISKICSKQANFHFEKKNIEFGCWKIFARPNDISIQTEAW